MQTAKEDVSSLTHMQLCLASRVIRSSYFELYKTAYFHDEK